MVRGSAREKLWDHLVYTHHYLGFPWIVGAYLKYLAYLDGRLVACLGWGSAAWRVSCRDAFIGWDWDDAKGIRDILSHHYYHVDPVIVFDVCQEKLPGLIQAINAIREELANGPAS
jgi:hypothetical protein